jgi:putative transposase
METRRPVPQSRRAGDAARLFKKNINQSRIVKERKALLDREDKLSLRKQAELLEVDRSCFYYKPLGESDTNRMLMELIDRLFLDDPTLGVKGMRDELRDQGFTYNDKRIRRMMRKMCIMPIYNKRNLSRLGLVKYIHPYLLRHMKIERPNQVWDIDITYIPMKRGFLYLTAIIDVYSRYIVGWQLSNSLDKETQTALLLEAVRRYGKPEILNSDQRSQYTYEHWVNTLNELGIQISMDGRGRATDNAFIERFGGTLKRKYVYLNPAEDGLALYEGIKTFMQKYNNRYHQGINREKPIDRYLKAA